jgi:hypothetical protein
MNGRVCFYVDETNVSGRHERTKRGGILCILLPKIAVIYRFLHIHAYSCRFLHIRAYKTARFLIIDPLLLLP